MCLTWGFRDLQKALSGRCLQRTLEQYRDQNPPWAYAQHYLEYALGRQAYTMGDSALAVEHFLRMLRIRGVQEDQSGVLENLSLAYKVGRRSHTMSHSSCSNILTLLLGATATKSQAGLRKRRCIRISS